VREEEEAEFGSIFNPGCRKLNLNHLLNFQYSPRGGGRDGQGDVQGRRRGPNGGRVARGKGSFNNFIRPKSYTKSHYLQANCQFIVQSLGDYSLHLADPDTLVDWDRIEQVHLRAGGSSSTNCPICLCPPVAGKISRCGHVFCWPCVLHYLALSDDSSRKCPICDHQICRPELRSVILVPQPQFSTGDTITMKLMKRDRNSLLAVPAGDAVLQDFPAVNEEGIDRNFVKMLKATVGQVKRNIIARERRELEVQYEEDKDQPESCFIMEALALLDKREMEATEIEMLEGKVIKVKEVMVKPKDSNIEKQEKSLVTDCQTIEKSVVDPFAEEDNLDDLIEIGNDSGEQITPTNPTTIYNPPRGRPRSRYASGQSETSSEGEEMVEDIVETEVTAEDLEIEHTKTVAQEPRQTFYFYQSSDGQPIFLHALNVQMLVAEFGSLEVCPPSITATILEKDTATMTEELRDRLRYLRHLPVASSFEVTEMDIKDVLSKETLASFKDQVDRRRRKRKMKQREEQRRERKIKAEEQRMMGFPGSMKRVESGMLIRDRKDSEEVTGEEFPTMEGIDIGRNQEEGTSDGLSFANIAKTRKFVPAPVMPKSSSTPSGWVSLGQVSSRPGVTAKRQEDSEPEPEGYIPPPKPVSLGDTLAAALERVDVSIGGGRGKKKGRKGKPILLTGGPPRPVL